MKALAVLACLRPSIRWRHSPSTACVQHMCQAQIEEDTAFMRMALDQASAAFRAGEIPIGSVLVHEGRCISAEHNRVEELQDASAHAEMLCMRNGAAAMGSWRLLDTTLYVTVEPCPMCMAALYAFRVGRLVYGTVNPKLGAVESDLKHPLSALHPYHSHTVG